ncbi:hypothetical protein FE840_018080 (plasmid) [Peteryoungia desertarenae]|uniref:Uncharacterized protein n=1 Tax=Peteryoungia desertarenae TaxID=1813451 RepID=A0ABX6QTM6_9HYPH|nr:hypothetical protein FE840_018080 [Peteryoungia desertarenae]
MTTLTSRETALSGRDRYRALTGRRLINLAGLIKGDGVVHLDGQMTANPICYMPQDTAANAVLTVYESVLLAAKQGTNWQVADQEPVEIDGILASLGFTDLGFRDLGQLSGGQRQARVVWHDP